MKMKKNEPKYKGQMLVFRDHDYEWIDLGTETNRRRLTAYANEELRAEPGAKFWLITDGVTTWCSDYSLRFSV